jgi:hypothetical protein
MSFSIAFADAWGLHQLFAAEEGWQCGISNATILMWGHQQLSLEAVICAWCLVPFP